MTLLFLLIYFAIIMTVIEIHVILFQLTGLKKKVSRFQVISMMTGTGYTTGESEFILSHPFRRKLGVFLILFGAFSLAVIISSVSSLFEDDLRTSSIIYIAVSLIIVLSILKLPVLQKYLVNKLEHKEEKEESSFPLPIREVTLKDIDGQLVEYQIKADSPLINNTVNQIMEDHEFSDFVILMIKRGDVRIRKNIAEEQFQSGDRLYFFGHKPDIEEALEKEIQ
ncbi:TrkA C-terminal domain-containing protein [uncultured Metabacillus sp.]|uniref:TrkA C-terminal domain-containing protein n=1 Tax=uncultured Metabacillus sp. TaxID=2860135 RepID=UPI0026219AA4|nr:TrkA C-terminal domain-containing protein [uncultured Metabacillus sp.]